MVAGPAQGTEAHGGEGGFDGGGSLGQEQIAHSRLTLREAKTCVGASAHGEATAAGAAEAGRRIWWLEEGVGTRRPPLQIVYENFQADRKVEGVGQTTLIDSPPGLHR